MPRFSMVMVEKKISTKHFGGYGYKGNNIHLSGCHKVIKG